MARSAERTLNVERFERVWEGRERRRSGEAGQAEGGKQDATGYYGVPPVHAAHWGWMIALYFFLGGLSGASYVIAVLAGFARGESFRSTVRTGRYLSLAALIPGGLLLIADLGKSARFLNMMRVIKFRSPMSLGSWGLAAFGMFSTLSVSIQMAEDGKLGDGLLASLIRRLPGRMIGLVGMLPAFFVSGYTGVLLGITAIPIWARNGLLMGPLFICSSMSTAAAAILLAKPGETESDAALHRVEETAAVAELAVLAASAVVLGSLAEPMRQGKRGRAFVWGTLVAGLGLPLLLNRVSRRPGWRGLSTIASMLALTGGILLRFTIVDAGKASAADPSATFRTTRQ